MYLRNPGVGLLVALFFSLTQTARAESFGTLMVAPTRLVFEGRTRTQEVTLINRGKEETTYRIALKNMRMREDGTYEDITAPVEGEQFADSFIRFAPRQVTLKPGASQTVRVMVAKPAGLVEGEYRSHLYFRTVPPENTGNDAEALATGEEKFSVRLTPVFGVSIPVIVEHGALGASATVDKVTLAPSGKSLDVAFTRSGNRSVYGDVKVFDGEKIIGTVRGISLLFPYPKRRITIPLQSVPAQEVRLVYHAQDNPNQVWTEAYQTR